MEEKVVIGRFRPIYIMASDGSIIKRLKILTISFDKLKCGQVFSEFSDPIPPEDLLAEIQYRVNNYGKTLVLDKNFLSALPAEVKNSPIIKKGRYVKPFQKNTTIRKISKDDTELQNL